MVEDPGGLVGRWFIYAGTAEQNKVLHPPGRAVTEIKLATQPASQGGFADTNVLRPSEGGDNALVICRLGAELATFEQGRNQCGVLSRPFFSEFATRHQNLFGMS